MYVCMCITPPQTPKQRVLMGFRARREEETAKRDLEARWIFALFLFAILVSWQSPNTCDKKNIFRSIHMKATWVLKGCLTESQDASLKGKLTEDKKAHTYCETRLFFYFCLLLLLLWRGRSPLQSPIKDRTIWWSQKQKERRGLKSKNRAKQEPKQTKDQSIEQNTVILQGNTFFGWKTQNTVFCWKTQNKTNNKM